MLAILQALLDVLVLRKPILLIEPVIIATLAVVLRLTRSRVAAAILLAIVVIELIAQIVLMFYSGMPAFGSMVIPAVLTWLSIRAIQAAAFLQKHKGEDAG